MGEDELLGWLRRQSPELTGWIGDDAALLPPAPEQAVTVDSQIEGVHFLAGLAPERVARRLLAVNLSDLASVGARPAHAFLALSTPAGFDHRGFFQAFLEGCREHRLQLAGGDLATAPVVVATLTLIGHKPEGGHWLRRSNARAGDVLWLGGSVGESALGRHLLAHGAGDDGVGPIDTPEELLPAARRAIERHLAPRPQLELGLLLGRRERVAAVDLSDGLARDLDHLCRASGCGAVVDAEALPGAAGHEALCRTLGLDPLELKLGGGEDYVLLFTLPPGESPPAEGSCRRIGEITPKPSLRLRRAGIERELPALGWDHLGSSN